MKERTPLTLLLFLSTVFIFSFYGEAILHPDYYMFGNEGDAIKNYFTYAYHIKYDSAYFHFAGMNYPYGEHFLYTDCQPVLAGLVKLLASGFESLSGHSIGIMNFILILSVFLTFFVIYFLLKEFGVNKWFSLFFSIGITLMAPQIFRIGGHFGLSYSIAIPFSWFLLIKYLKNTGRKVYLVILFINGLSWLLIHAYLGMIIIAFLALIVICRFAFDNKRRERVSQYLLSFSAIILPVLIFYLFAVLTDTHEGRTHNPSGFFLYTAEFDDVFLPHHPPLRPLLDKLTGNIIRQQWEAWSYVGLSTTIVLIVMLVFSAMKLFNRKINKLQDSFFSPGLLNISLWSAFIVLLFAMAFPFKLAPGLADVLPIVKQFRATGRFAWPFYFAATVFAAAVMQKIYDDHNKKSGKIIALSLCIAFGLSNIAEGLPYHSETAGNIVKSRNLFKKELLTVPYQKAIEAVNPEHYQAILTLPFYYYGSESFSRPRIGETCRASMCFSYHTGIPLVNADLTRTSVQESKNIVQLISPDFYKKEAEIDLQGRKPFLVIRTRDPITRYEHDLLLKCEPVYISEDLSLYSLEMKDLFSNSAQTVFDHYFQIKPQLYKREQFLMTDDSSFLYYNGFENLKSDKPFRGNGGFQSFKKGENTLAEFEPYAFSPGNTYHVSVWMYNGINDALNDWFKLIIKEYDENSDIWTSSAFFPEQSEVIHGDWSLIEGTFEIKKPGNRIFIVTKGKDDSKQSLFIDDLLIKESSSDVYCFDEDHSSLFYNNHDIHLP